MKRTTKYVALDVHQATTVAAVRAQSGRVIARSILPTEPFALVEFFRGMRGSIHVAFEEGTQAQWLHDLLTPVVDQVIVCDRRGEPRGNKADQRDQGSAQRPRHPPQHAHRNGDGDRQQPRDVAHHDVVRLGPHVGAAGDVEFAPVSRLLPQQCLDALVQAEVHELRVGHRLERDVDRGGAAVAGHEGLAIDRVGKGSSPQFPQRLRFGRNPPHEAVHADLAPLGLPAHREDASQALDLRNARKPAEPMRQPREDAEILARKDVPGLHDDDVDVVVSEVPLRLLVDGNRGIVGTDEWLARRVDVDAEAHRIEPHEGGRRSERHGGQETQH